MMTLAVIVGSTRPVRRTAVAAEWVADVASRHPAVLDGTATVDLVDLADFDLPLLDEPLPAIFGEYGCEHTRRWAETIDACDGFVFVTPEYNHGVPGALKNAIDFLFAEWNDKAAGFVSHGVHGGTRAVEHLRLVLAELKVAGVRSQVALSAFTDFVIDDPAQPGVIAPGAHQVETLNEMLDELITWAEALRRVRRDQSVAA